MNSLLIKKAIGDLLITFNFGKEISIKQLHWFCPESNNTEDMDKPTIDQFVMSFTPFSVNRKLHI